jgi:hypothetical protein
LELSGTFSSDHASVPAARHRGQRRASVLSPERNQMKLSFNSAEELDATPCPCPLKK